MAGIKKILMLDDSAAVLSQMGKALEDAGYTVKTLTQGMLIEQSIAEPDLIIVDFHMPGVNGGQLLAAMREGLDKRTLPYLVYLYTSDTQAAMNYEKFGFDGCFTAKNDATSLVRQVKTASQRFELKRLSPRKPLASAAAKI